MSLPTSKPANLSARTWAIIAGAAVLALLAGAGGGYHVYAEAQPTQAGLSLRDGAREVASNRPLRLTLSRPVTLGGLKAAFHLNPAAEGRLAADGATTAASSPRGAFSSFTWTPAPAWADLTTYTVRLDSFNDAGGHRVQAAHWRFTTTVVPKVIALSTESGTALADDSELPVNSNLRVSFNSVMDQPATRILINGQPATLAWEADGRSAGLALKGLRPGPVEFSLADGGHDTGGRPLSMDWKLKANLVFRISIHTTPLKRPALVQIPNDAGARDQSGLQAADVVYEYSTEGGVTRLTAVFSNAPDVIGPVRSGRLISFALTRHYGGTLLLSGLSDGSMARLNADPVATFFDTQGYFYRSRDRFPPDNLYISGSAVQRATDRYAPHPGLKPGPIPISAGDSGQSVSVPEHNSTYAFDAGTGTYTKTEDGHQLGDATIGQPLRIQLLVVMHTTATNTSYVEDVNGLRGLDFNMESGGRADFYSGGLHASGRWVSPDRTSPFRFELDNGQVVNLPSGLAFVDVVRG